MSAPNIDTIVSLAKRRGFVYPSSEIYGGLGSAWDYGPMGIELYNNVKIFPTALPLVRGRQMVKQKDGTEKAVESVVAWGNDYGKGRVFSTTIGHNNATVGDARYLDFVSRGLLWSCGKLGDDGKPKPGYEAQAK